jgi:hypothetical protein
MKNVEAQAAAAIIEAYLFGSLTARTTGIDDPCFVYCLWVGCFNSNPLILLSRGVLSVTIWLLCMLGSLLFMVDRNHSRDLT